MATAARGKIKTDIDEVLTESVRRRATPKQEVKEDERFADIASNTFFKIMFEEAMTPEQKRDALVSALTVTTSKEENKAKIAEFELFKEYLQNTREELAKQIIKLTDTDAFAELKDVYDQMNTGLIEFDDKMKFLTDIIDAVYEIRQHGATLDIFKEIQEDRQREEELKKQKHQTELEIRKVRTTVDNLHRNIDYLKTKRSFFGFGGITAEAQEQINAHERNIEAAKGQLSGLSKQIEELNAQEAERSKFGELAQQKAQLRKLLDISGEEHREKQKELVNAAVNFVETAKERIGAVRGHLNQMNVQVDRLFETNNTMAGIYAVMTDSLGQAEKKNQDIRSTLAEPAEAEGTIEKLRRENQKMAVEEYMTAMDAASVDTMASYSDLTSQTIRIKTMRDANISQMNAARTMHTQGVAGVADRLSVVLQAVSSAALGESSAMAKDTLHKMAQSTNTVAQKEAIRLAMGISDQNTELEKAIEDLAGYGEVMRTSTEISREGLKEMRAKLDELKSLAEGTQKDIQDAVGLNADVAAGSSGSKKEEQTVARPGFKF